MGEPQSGSLDDRRAARSQGVPRLSQIALLALFMIAAVQVAIEQPPRPDVLATSDFLSWDWWKHPVEWNAPLRLPEITSDFNAVYALPGTEPGTEKVWAVGNGGMVVFSPDGGASWEARDARIAEQPAKSSRGRDPPVSPAHKHATDSLSSWLPDLVTTAHAADQGPPKSAKPSKSDAKAQRPAESTAAPGPAGESRTGPGENPAEERPPQSTQPSTPTQYDPKAQRGPESTGGTDAAGEPAKKREEARSDQTPVQGPPPSTRESSASTPRRRRPTPTPTRVTWKAGDLLPDLIAVRFDNETLGWSMGRDGALFETRDGGRTWNSVSRNTKPMTLTGFHSGRLTIGTRALLVEDAALSGIDLATGAREYYLNLSPIASASLKFGFARFRGVALVEPGSGPADYWAVGLNGMVVRITVASGFDYEDQTERVAAALKPQEPTVPTLVDLYGVHFAAAQQGWIVGDKGAIVATSDQGKTWRRQPSGTSSLLRAVYFRDSQRGWIVGNDGTILATDDGGAHWRAQTRGSLWKGLPGVAYSRWLPPWFYVAFLVCVAGLLLVDRREKSEEGKEQTEASVADVLLSDRPLERGEPDAMDFARRARGIANFIRNQATSPPLTLAITGEWGSGKSSLMNMVHDELTHYGYRPVWFNAWHHQHKEQQLKAALFQNLQLQAIFPPSHPFGLWLRVRLLARRLVRQPLVLGAVVMLVSAFSYWAWQKDEAGYTMGELALFDIVDYVYKLGQQDMMALPSLGKAAGTVATLLSGLFALWRGTRIFGESPASLLAGASAGASAGQLDAQAGFNKRFGDEFGDFTQALGARRLVIFIDDLDRCQPAQVLEVLEAVNYLVSSGHCFVILGMARPPVESCVGLSFSEIASEMAQAETQESSDRRKTAPQNQPAGKKPEAERAIQAGAPNPDGSGRKETPAQDHAAAEDADSKGARQRRLFARQYLDKLINIEVPVQAPSQEQADRLISGNVRPRVAEKPQLFQRVLRMAKKLAPALVATLVVITGVQLGQFVVERLAPPPAPLVARLPSAGPVTTPGPTPKPEPRVDQPAGTVVQSGQRGEFKPAASPPPRPRTWPAYGLLALFGALAIWLLSQPADRVLRDSPEFARALKIWLPLVFHVYQTPRALKRFLNRLRYYAMCQRPATQGESRWRQLVRRLQGWWTSEEKRTPPPPVIEGAIFEPHLVALAAVHALEELSKQPLLATDGKLGALRSHEAELFRTAKAAHEKAFGDWQPVVQSREAYLKITEGVTVR